MMKQEYEDRLQRAKKKLYEEKARRRDDDGRDDASYVSEMSRNSRASFCSEYSRASARKREKEQDTRGPRSEWRNKAREVIERGKVRKEEAEMLKDDASYHSRKSTSSLIEREAQIDSLVDRNARLNEREKMIKIERDLLDAAEAEGKAEGDSYYDLQNRETDGGSFESQQTSSTIQTTTSSRAKRVRDDIEEEDLNRSFQQAKAAWQVREKTNPTPLKSNVTSEKATTIPTSASFQQPSSPGSEVSPEVITSRPSWVIKGKRAPESPESVKSSRSIKASRSAKSDQPFFGRSNKSTKISKYGSPKSPNSPGAKSEQMPRNYQTTGDSPIVRTPTMELETKLSYRQSFASLNRSSFSEAGSHGIIGSSSSVSSFHSKRSRHSYRGGSKAEAEDEENMENNLPVELSIPVLTEDSTEDGENQPPIVPFAGPPRELSYREKSAILASMESVPNENNSDEDDEPIQRNMFRQRGQVVKKTIQHNFMRSTTGSNTGSILGTKSTTVHVLGEKNYNAKKNVIATTTTNVVADTNRLMDATKQLGNLQLGNGSNAKPQDLQLSNLVNENKELKARLEKERNRRSELDEKTTQLQLEIHHRGEEISDLKKRKDVSASHKEQIYKLEDSLQEANRYSVTVMDENVKLREDLELERAKRGHMEAQARHFQAKLKQKSEEVVVLARELKRKEDRFNEALSEERHQREVTEAHLAKACLHIQKSEEERDDDMDELERENCELRHTVQRLEQLLKQKIGGIEDRDQLSAMNTKSRKSNNGNNNNKSRRQSGGSLQEDGMIASKPTWTTAISEITTDFDFEELNNSQMGEI